MVQILSSETEERCLIFWVFLCLATHFGPIEIAIRERFGTLGNCLAFQWLYAIPRST